MNINITALIANKMEAFIKYQIYGSIIVVFPKNVSSNPKKISITVKGYTPFKDDLISFLDKLNPVELIKIVITKNSIVFTLKGKKMEFKLFFIKYSNVEILSGRVLTSKNPKCANDKCTFNINF